MRGKRAKQFRKYVKGSFYGMPWVNYKDENKQGFDKLTGQAFVYTQRTLDGCQKKMVKRLKRAYRKRMKQGEFSPKFG